MPTIATILVALDIERGACDTCDEAGLVARAFGARVVAVNAQAEPEQAGDAALEARDQEFLAELTARIGAASPPTLVRRVGAPADVILGVAERESADLIVLGAAPKAAVERILMGATAEAVLRRATVPVWVVPAGALAGGSASWCAGSTAPRRPARPWRRQPPWRGPSQRGCAWSPSRRTAPRLRGRPTSATSRPTRARSTWRGSS